MTAPTPSAPDTARELVTMPEPARGSARAARQALEEPAGEAGDGGSPPFTMNGGAAGAAPPKPPRKGGHKPTKAELEADLAEAHRRLEAITGEKPPAAVEAELGLRGALAGTFGAAFNFAASSRGSYWRLEPDEQDQLAAAWAPVFAPYMASSAEYLPWAVAAGVTYSVVEPRLRRDGERAGRELVLEPNPAQPVTPPASSPPRPAAATPPAAAASSNGARAHVRPLDPPAPVDSGPERELERPGDSLSDHPAYRPGRAI